MKGYIAALARMSEAANAAAEKAVPKPAAPEFTPLETQIQHLMAVLSENHRQRDWTMADLIARLTGKYRSNPHAMQVGAALRRLGWSPHRDYSRAGAGARVWRHP
jgi:phage gp29-like protein